MSEVCDIAFKDMSGSEKDAGFCSGEDENLHSPSGSEDSVEVQISPISLRNKRKLAEPKKALKSDPNRPLKKRRFIERTSSPFRPWSAPEKEEDRWKAEEERRRSEEVQRLYEARIHAQVLARLQSAAHTTEIRTATVQQTEICADSEAVALEITKNSRNFSSRTATAHLYDNCAATAREIDDHTANLPPGRLSAASMTGGIRTATLQTGGGLRTATARPQVDIRATNLGFNGEIRTATVRLESEDHQEEPLALVLREGRVPPHPGVSELPYEDKKGKIPSSRMSSTSGALSEQSAGHSQRNYKNMTRERRIEANARERTRVHTISAAFNTLRRSIPAYSHNQKLSKLSVLRIACSYIMTLSKIVTNGEEGPEEVGGGVGVGMELGECVDLVSRTIQTEGKLRKKKDD